MGKTAPSKRLICIVCKKPIAGRVYYQGDRGDSYGHPVHKRCLVVIRAPRRGE